MIDMLKKILIATVILGIAAVAFLVFGSYEVVKEEVSKKEPQIRQYVQLDEAAQNKYILDNCRDILKEIDLDNDGKPDDKEQLELLMKANENPAVQKSLVDLGRSLMAKAIMASEPIVKDLSADVKAKYQQESDNFVASFETYANIVKKVEPRIK